MNDCHPLLARSIRRLRLPIGGLLIGLIGYLDFQTGPYLSLLLFYLIPIGLVTWYGRLWQGVLLTSGSTGIWLVDAAITPFAERTPALAVWNISLRVVLFLIIVGLLTRLKQALTHERRLARMDPLTGVYNRRSFTELLTREHRRAGRYHHPFTVAYLDLDNFKWLNDHRGHTTGDQVLTTVGTILQAQLRQTDSVARLGGDEFALLLPETDSEAAQRICQRVHQALLGALATSPWPVTCSIGVVTYLDPPRSRDEVLRTADCSMYAAKQRGKAQLVHAIYAHDHAAVGPSQ